MLRRETPRALLAHRLAARSYRKQGWGGKPFLEIHHSPRTKGYGLGRKMLEFVLKGNVAGVKRILDLCLQPGGAFEDNVDLGFMTIEMLGKNGCPSEARRVFDTLPKPNGFAWHFMVQAYVLAGEVDEARRIYNRIPLVMLSTHTRNVMLGAYLSKDRLADGKAFYDRKPVHDLVTWCIMFSAFMRRDLVDSARGMLWNMPKTRIDVAWNVVIQAYCKKGLLDRAKEVFDSMPGRNPITYRMMVTAYARRGDLELAKKLLEEMEEVDFVAWNEVIQGYARLGHLGRAMEMMERHQGRIEDVSLIAMTLAAGRLGKISKAEYLMSILTSISDAALNALLVAYARSAHVDEAEEVFRKLEERNEVSWSNMIQCYAQQDRLVDADELFEECPYECVFASTAMVGVYARAGVMFQAARLFESLVLKNSKTWTAMIGGYARIDRPKTALELFFRMGLDGVAPDRVTFAAVLSACQLKEARRFFWSITRDYDFAPELEHYHCVLEALGKSKKLLGQAEELVHSMPFHPDLATWTILKSACEAHGDSARAAKIPAIPDKFKFVSAYDRAARRHFVDYLEEDLPDRDPSQNDYGIPMAHLFRKERGDRW